MRIKSILVASLALFAGALTSCNKGSDEINKVEEGNTYASVTLSFGENDFRADDEVNDFNPKGEWEGNDAIKTVDVYLVDAAKVSSGQYTLTDFNVEAVAGQETKLMPKKAIKTTAGDKNVYVLVNAPDEIRQTLAVTTKADFETAWAKIYEAHNVAANTKAYPTKSAEGMMKLAKLDGDGKDIIMMSNEKLYTFNVKENVTYEQAMDTAAPKNRAIVPVKRAAARVVVTTSELQYDITNPTTNKIIGTISDITYAVAQGEKKLHIQQLIDNGIIKTPAYDIITNPFVKPGSYNSMNDFYDYSDLFVKDRSVIKSDYASLDAKMIGELQKPAFMLEANHKRNTPAGNTPATYDGGFFRSNTPYVLVRTKFKPTQDALAENNVLADLPADGTFYVGSVTGKIYTSAANVYDPAKGGLKGQTYRKYVKGKVLYYAYVNPDIIERPKTLNAPVFRNNVYHVHIRAIKALGFNWNPLYPEDPDTTDPNWNGDPNDPNAPVNPDPRPNKENPSDPNDPGEDPTTPVKPDDPLGDKDIYMSVSVKVLKWNVHSYEVDLGL
ncbi:Mfa1 family fimbria major subunit [Porphyromonas circumdentaria]|uniref:Mfa1 family fimbria major subunit n=1 Tax=Porphyromonas circumdentaria TaxID=29524 RepID=UPI0026DB7CD5|nr:Mfa1 family fimbria major subunit [Porphyromonas circumdentaria]MDO4722075.1 Mfa1 family fimbria major subunit [Porphyromonas circumdentaria]